MSGVPCFTSVDLSVAFHGHRQVKALLGRFSGFRVFLIAAPSQELIVPSGFMATFVTGYSGGSVPESHRIPY